MTNLPRSATAFFIQLFLIYTPQVSLYVTNITILPIDTRPRQDVKSIQDKLD